MLEEKEMMGDLLEVVTVRGKEDKCAERRGKAHFEEGHLFFLPNFRPLPDLEYG